ncbi:hypothetical protein VF07_37830, partial [Nostoc linckia z6]
IQNSGVRIQESEFRSQNSGVRIQESEFRSQNSGVRIQESEFRSQNSGVRSQKFKFNLVCTKFQLDLTGVKIGTIKFLPKISNF